MADNYVVPPRSWSDIADLTTAVRERFGLAEVPRFPIMELIERVLDHQLNWLHLRVGMPDEMGGAEGLTHPAGDHITLREDVYQKAWALDGRARFTAAHELGHWVMHTNVPLARMSPGVKYAPYELAEQQANAFAAELLMPRDFIMRSDTPLAVASRHAVSLEAARIRVDYLRKKGLL